MDVDEHELSSGDGLPQETGLTRFAKGNTLFQEGSDGREMYILRSGRVQVSITRDDRSVPIAELGTGCHVGEMSFIAAIPRTATVVALEPVTAIRIGPEVLADDALSIFGWAIGIARVLVDRVKRTTELLGDYMANGSHPPSADSSEQQAAGRPSFALKESDNGGSIKLQGVFDRQQTDSVKEAVRKALLRHPNGIVIEFSGVIDMDAHALEYLLHLARSPQARDGKIQLRNLQLIRNKVAGMKEIRDLIESVTVPSRRVASGEYLIRQGERERLMFVVRSGEFDILQEREDEEPILLGKSRAGDVVGEMSLVSEGDRSASVRAVKDSVVLEITPQEFLANIHAVPDWFMEVLKGLVDRLRDTTEMLHRITTREQPAGKINGSKTTARTKALQASREKHRNDYGRRESATSRQNSGRQPFQVEPAEVFNSHHRHPAPAGLARA